MSDYRFAVNLRRETLSDTYRRLLPPWGYLLSPDNATGPLRAAASALQGQGLELVADNGNFDVIGDIAASHTDAAHLLAARVRGEEALLGRRARRGDLSPLLVADCTALASQVRVEALLLANRGEAYVSRQLELNPTRLIGAEDITQAAWLSLGLEPDALSYERQTYRRMNERVAKRALQVMKRLSPAAAAAYYPVASALSYNTALDAGRVFATAGLRRVSMGFGAYMADDQYNDHFTMGRRVVKLPSLMPNRYLRTAVVARAFWEGYREAGGAPPEAFHFLGLGAPIMVGLVSLFAWETPLLTFDATSPIRDAGEGTFYVSAPSYLKIRGRSAAYRLASSPAATWLCPCPFCAWFTATYPFDYAAGRAWFAANRPKRVTQRDLSPGGGLFAAYPLLGEPRAGQLRKDVSFARLGHNHWALEDILSGLRAHSASRDDLKSFLAGVVASYTSQTASDRFAQSIQYAFDLAAGTAP